MRTLAASPWDLSNSHSWDIASWNPATSHMEATYRCRQVTEPSWKEQVPLDPLVTAAPADFTWSRGTAQLSPVNPKHQEREQNAGCFKPLWFEVVCYIAMKNENVSWQVCFLGTQRNKKEEICACIIHVCIHMCVYICYGETASTSVQCTLVYDDALCSYSGPGASRYFISITSLSLHRNPARWKPLLALEVTKARSQVTYPRSHSWLIPEQRFQPDSSAGVQQPLLCWRMFHRQTITTKGSQNTFMWRGPGGREAITESMKRGHAPPPPFWVPWNISPTIFKFSTAGLWECAGQAPVNLSLFPQQRVQYLS